MKTNIIHTLRQWAPEATNLIGSVEAVDETVADYKLLGKLAEVCVMKINSKAEKELEEVQDIVNVINMLYQGGNQYTKNAIENEFLTRLSFEETPGSLKMHLNLFPEELKKGYIKTILEN